MDLPTKLLAKGLLGAIEPIFIHMPRLQIIVRRNNYRQYYSYIAEVHNALAKEEIISLTHIPLGLVLLQGNPLSIIMLGETPVEPR